MNHKQLGFVPQIDRREGACLTARNWEESLVHALSYSLAALLIKPGKDLFGNLSGLATFLGWSKTMVLDARLAKVDKEGNYPLQSPYDGSKFLFSPADVRSAIIALAPDYVLLPTSLLEHCPALWENWPQTVFPFLPLNALAFAPEGRGHGVYIEGAFEQSRDSIHLARDLPFMAVGDMGFESLQAFHKAGAVAILSERPASDAYEGLMYTHEAVIDLKEPAMAQQFAPMDTQCACPVCRQGLTCAYLHHLLNHTPLLCHRFLIQHNASVIQQITALEA